MPAIPKLFNPVDVVIEFLDKGSENTHPVTGEPLNNDSTVFVIKGQWVPVDDRKLGPKAGGDSPTNNGYVVVKAGDMEKILEDCGGTFRTGDRIVTVGGAPVDAVILSVEHHAHYFGKPQLIFLVYEDKQRGLV